MIRLSLDAAWTHRVNLFDLVCRYGARGWPLISTEL